MVGSGFTDPGSQMCFPSLSLDIGEEREDPPATSLAI
jgi:hypothetical protein